MLDTLITHSIEFSTPLGLVRRIELPNKCSHCKRLTTFSYKAITFNKQFQRVESAVCCNYGNCKGILIVYYDLDNDNGTGKLSHIEPPIFEEISIPEFANDVSPSFVAIFNESVEAKSRGLNQIAGAGFRKACEFLIKDYAKSLISETDETKKEKLEQQIEKKFVGQVVTDFIPDPRVQKVAKRTFWLGNDETHYLRKWTDKDIDDLITLIKLTLAWIEIERLSDKYEDEMPEA